MEKSQWRFDVEARVEKGTTESQKLRFAIRELWEVRSIKEDCGTSEEYYKSTMALLISATIDEAEKINNL